MNYPLISLECFCLFVSLASGLVPPASVPLSHFSITPLKTQKAKVKMSHSNPPQKHILQHHMPSLCRCLYLDFGGPNVSRVQRPAVIQCCKSGSVCSVCLCFSLRCFLPVGPNRQAKARAASQTTWASPEITHRFIFVCPDERQSSDDVGNDQTTKRGLWRSRGPGSVRGPAARANGWK